MSGFALGWLRLRAPFDAAARAPDLLARFAAALPSPARLVDLGSGAGATLRAVSPAIRGDQRWTLVDHDAALLEAVPAESTEWADRHGWPLRHGGDTLRIDCGGWRIEATPRHADLAEGLADLDLAQADAVLASALLDLVSADWCAALARRCAEAGTVVYLALSFDGRLAWTPEDPLDAPMRDAFRAHMRRDKGFGPALGAEAPARMAEALMALGYRVALRASDWRIAPGNRAMHDAFLDGLLAAVKEQAPLRAAAFAAWAERRRRQIAAGALHLQVGHRDLLALPRA